MRERVSVRACSSQEMGSDERREEIIEVSKRCSDEAPRRSVTEVEVVVGVGVVLALAEHRAEEVEGTSGEEDAHPDAHAVVDDDALQEEALDTSVHKVEEPLLSGVGAVMEDVAASV